MKPQRINSTLSYKVNYKNKLSQAEKIAKLSELGVIFSPGTGVIIPKNISEETLKKIKAIINSNGFRLVPQKGSV